MKFNVKLLKTGLVSLISLFIFNSACISQAKNGEMEIQILKGEKIWSGVIKDGHKMPYSKGSRFDFYANNMENQIQPLLLGSKGLWVWSEEPYAFEIKDNKIIITNARGEIKSGHSGNSLADACNS